MRLPDNPDFLIPRDCVCRVEVDTYESEHNSGARTCPCPQCQLSGDQIKGQKENAPGDTATGATAPDLRWAPRHHAGLCGCQCRSCQVRREGLARERRGGCYRCRMCGTRQPAEADWTFVMAWHARPQPRMLAVCQPCWDGTSAANRYPSRDNRRWSR
jgi:hypothetical protein